MRKKIGLFILLGFVCTLLSSCKTTPSKPAVPSPQPVQTSVSNCPVSSVPVVPSPENIIVQAHPAAAGIRQNICHTVSPGETLWRISKMYDVPMREIMKTNNLKDPEELNMGQKLYIKNAAKMKSIIPLYPSKKWKYIIIHHSATDVGDALTFYASHKKRGWSEGLGYHFVIDNGTKTKADGQIEISPRWIKQQNGAHCKANSMNSRGIGVCLVGNFSQDKVSDKQMEALVYLVNLLRRYYDIPLKKIKGHGEVKGACTECPGKKFPWNKFFAKLTEEDFQ